MPSPTRPLAGYAITGTAPARLPERAVTLRYARSKALARHYDKMEGGANCGTGKGGFQSGNRCGKSKGGGTATATATAARPRAKASPSQGTFFGHEGDTSATVPSKGAPPRFAKLKASKPDALVEARRVGAGAEAKIVLADGTEAPPHVRAAKIPPAWTHVRVSLDPNSDLLAQGRDAQGNAKSVYQGDFEDRTKDAKFARTREASAAHALMVRQIQEHRQSADPKVREAADVALLIKHHGTRPASEKDKKGLGHLYGKPLSAGDVEVVPPKNAKDRERAVLHLNHEGQRLAVPVKDEKTTAELLRRLRAGEDLHDSTFWLKSHGATTLEGRHIVPTPEGVSLRFVGKESIWNDHPVRDPEVARMLLARKAQAGENGQLFNTNEKKLNDYIKTLDGGGFTAKDFRTLKATRLAASLVKRDRSCCADPKEYRKKVMDVARRVSRVLGNQPEQALESYIDPRVFTTWRHGDAD